MNIIAAFSKALEGHGVECRDASLEHYAVKGALREIDAMLVSKPAPDGKPFDEAPQDGSWFIMVHPEFPRYGHAVRWDECGWWLCPGSDDIGGRDDTAIKADYPEWAGYTWVEAEIYEGHQIRAKGEGVFIANAKRTAEIIFQEKCR